MGGSILNGHLSRTYKANVFGAQLDAFVDAGY